MSPRLSRAAACAVLAIVREAAADTGAPAAAAPPAPRSPAMIVAGSVLSLVGGVAVVAGAVRLTVTATCPGVCADPPRSEAIGGVMLGAGAAVLAGGVVLIVLGSRRAPGTAALPTWVGAPAGGGWTWRF